MQTYDWNRQGKWKWWQIMTKHILHDGYRIHVYWRMTKNVYAYKPLSIPKIQFPNIVTGEETWVHYFEPVRKIGNKILQTKYSRMPLWQTIYNRMPVQVVKWPISTKKALYCNWWHNRTNSDAGGQKITEILFKKYKYHKRPVSGFRHACPLQDMPHHIHLIV